MMKNKIFLACLLPVLSVASPMMIQADQEDTISTEASATHSTVHELESLFVLMQERLSLMHDVSRYKWNAELKGKILDEEELKLQESGLENEAFIATFFQAQNEAAFALQNQDFALFEKEKVGKFTDVKDFDKEIYPYLRMINEEMLITINHLLVYTQNESLPDFLKEISFPSFEKEGIHSDIYNIAIDPLFRD